MSVINTNVMSLNAQRNLTSSQNMLQNSLQRLSSGLRINSAKDDAAGLAISERFSAQIRGMNQAVRNANDGISYAQTAEGALGEISNQLQRIRELAVQSANETNTASDRESLNNEVRQAVSEINRIASTSQFNGKNILDGALGNLTFQVGANAGQTINVGGVDSRGNQLGAVIANTKVDGVSLGDVQSDVVMEGGIAKLSLNALDLTTPTDLGAGASFITIDGQKLIFNENLTGTAEQQIEKLASLIEGKIASANGLNASDYSVSFNAAEKTISIQNMTQEKVTIQSSLVTGAQSTGTQDTAANGTPRDITAAAATAVGAGGIVDGTFDGTNGAWTADVEVTIDGDVYKITLDSLNNPGANTAAGFITELNAQLASNFDSILNSGQETNALVASDNGGTLEFENNTLKTIGVTVTLNDGSSNVIDGVSSTLPAGTPDAPATASLTHNNGGVDISLGASGTLTVSSSTDRTAAGGWGAVGAIKIDLEVGATSADLVKQVRAGLDALGLDSSLVGVTVEDANTVKFAINDTELAYQFQLDLTDFDNMVKSDATLAAADAPTLNQFFDRGNTVTFEAEVNGSTVSIVDARSLTDVVNSINTLASDTGVKASLSSDGKDIFFTGERGADFEVALKANFNSADVSRELTADRNENSAIVDQLSVATIEDANRTLLVADYALDQVNSLRGELGAIQNRFEAAISNLRVGSENLSAANSRIRDADFAAETAELTRAQILQQAGTTVLAQANQIPNSVLALLQ